MLKSHNVNCLSEHDQAVLDTIFNPYQIGGGAENIINFNEELSEEVKDPEEENSLVNEESYKYEVEAIEKTEKGEYLRALELFQKAIEITPKKASLRNNRAQTYRLLENDDAAEADLNEALILSSFKGRTGCRAYCQRGLLKRKNKDDNGAREDFNKAAKLGSKFARAQLVELNPYAALCNQMLRQTFEKLS